MNAVIYSKYSIVKVLVYDKIGNLYISFESLDFDAKMDGEKISNEIGGTYEIEAVNDIDYLNPVLSQAEEGYLFDQLQTN